MTNTQQNQPYAMDQTIRDRLLERLVSEASLRVADVGLTASYHIAWDKTGAAHSVWETKTRRPRLANI